MSEYIHLIGSEEVQRAGVNMQSAANEMTLAADRIEQSLLAHQRHMDEWLEQFGRAIAALKEDAK